MSGLRWLVEDMRFFWGLAIGLLGIVVTVAIGLWQYQPKRLSYEVIEKVRLIANEATTAARGFSHPLTVYYGTRQLTDPYLLTVRIKNSGKRGIAASDYQGSIAIAGKNQQPLDGFVSDSRPEDLDPTNGQVLYAGGSMQPLKPPMLNPGEWFDLQFISDGDPGEVVAKARFLDSGKKGMRDAHGQNILRRLVRDALLSVAAGTLAVSLGAFTPAAEGTGERVSAAAAFAGIAFVLLFIKTLFISGPDAVGYAWRSRPRLRARRNGN
ncbi:hypothetical protein ACI8AF_03165 [Blastococcus sp. SYSU D00669]